MPLLTRIRESMTKIFAVFAGLFIVYIVLDWGMDITGRKNTQRNAESQMVGFVDGEGITYHDFAELVQQNLDAQRQQTGQDPEDFAVRAVRDQVWNGLVTDKLYNKEIDRLGLGVSDQEIVDAVKGDNPPDFLRTQFTDSLGNFNRQAYDQAIGDPRNKQIMLNLERVIRQQKLRAKLQSVILAGVTVTEGDVAKKFADDNVAYQAEVLSLDPGTLSPDSTTVPTDEELRSYYDKHITDYKVEAMRKVKYVTFALGPQASDSEYVRKELEDIARRVREGASFEELAGGGSNDATSEVIFNRAELETATGDILFSAKPGDVVGPLLQRDGYHLIKVYDFTKGKDEYIRAQHVLIRPEGGDSAAAREKARLVATKARAGEDFGALAVQYSVEPGVASSRGELGWFGKGRMVKGFEDPVFAAKAGTIVGPIKTEFGYHVVKVLARETRQARTRDYKMVVTMSPKTQGDVAQRAQDFAYFAKEHGLEKEAETDKLPVVETAGFTREGSIVSIGTYRAINRFAFESKIGDVSEAIQFNKGWGVFTLTDIKEAGVKPFDEVKDAITVLVRREKKNAKAVEFASGLLKSYKAGDSLGTLTASAPGARVERIDSMKVTTTTSRFGREAAVVGALEALAPGQVSVPVTGPRSVYVVRLLSRTAFDSSAYRAQRGTILGQLLQQKRERYFTDWTEKLKEGANIEDRRDLFYR